MKNQKGVTLIALIITIIVMLILVVVTINIATTGGLIDKASDAKTNTQAATKNELNETNSAGWEILEAVIQPETFEQNKLYNNIYINPNPPKLADLNPEVLDLLEPDPNDNGNEYIYINLSNDDVQVAARFNPSKIGVWDVSSKTFTASETEPSNPSEDDYWYKASLNTVYQYINNTWVEQEGFTVSDGTNNIPELAENGDLAVYTGGEEPALMEYNNTIVLPEGIIFFVVNSDGMKVYTYISSEEEAILMTQELEKTINQGWNEMILQENGDVISTTPISYSQVPVIENMDFDNYTGEQFEDLKPYIGYYFRSTPW